MVDPNTVAFTNLSKLRITCSLERNRAWSPDPKDMALALLQNSLHLDTLETRSWQTPETLMDFILARRTLQELHISVTIFSRVTKQALDVLPESIRKLHISVGLVCDMSISDDDYFF